MLIRHLLKGVRNICTLVFSLCMFSVLHQLCFCSDTNDLSVTQYIKSGINVDCPSYHKSTPLHFAALENNIDVVRELTRNSADVNARNKFLETPLHWAARAGDVYCCKLLLEHGASPELVDDDGNLPLVWAIEQGHLPVVKLLLSTSGNAILNFENDYGFTAWEVACEYYELEIFKYLIELPEFDLYHTNKENGNNILHHAVEIENVFVIRILFAKFSINELEYLLQETNHLMQTPKDIAKLLDDDAIYTLLCELMEDKQRKAIRGSSQGLRINNVQDRCVAQVV